MPQPGPQYREAPGTIPNIPGSPNAGDFLQLLSMLPFPGLGPAMMGALRIPRAAAKAGDIIASHLLGSGEAPLLSLLRNNPVRSPRQGFWAELTRMNNEKQSFGQEAAQILGWGRHRVGEDIRGYKPIVHRAYKGLGMTPMGSPGSSEYLNDFMMIIDMLSRGGNIP